MKQIHVKNNSLPLNGKVLINGSKNAALPIMAASILTDEQVVLSNVPNLSDISTMLDLLRGFGADIELKHNPSYSASHVLDINCKNINHLVAPHHIVSKMRASCLTLGPLLTKFKKARVAFPGGCAIGARPINMHLEALSKMGAHISIDNCYIDAAVNGKLQGAHIKFASISVGATENIMISAVLASGETIIDNAAVEPEVCDLANFLVAMGAKIKGIGTRRLTIKGVDSLSGCEYKITPDRLEAGTYALASIVTNGQIELEGIKINQIDCIIKQLKCMGAIIKETTNGILVSRGQDFITPLDISTNPYPKFPSDMQAQFTAVLCLANGVSSIQENIFENRFMHVPELKKMGANIEISGDKIFITGVKDLYGTRISATDLRASASLLISSLVAKGETIIENIDHLYRGYENIEEKLNSCGANIELINVDQPGYMVNT